jgi:hypothetical protein
MKKINLVFIILIIIEIVVAAITYFIPGDISPSPGPSFLNPLGMPGKGPYILIYKYGVPASPFYIAADLLILTVVAYFIYLLIKKFSKKG